MSCSTRRDGISAADFQYSVQQKSDLHALASWIVPSEVYERVRNIASLLPVIEIG